MQKIDRQFLGQESFPAIVVDLHDVDVRSCAYNRLHVTLQVLKALSLLLLVIFAIVELSKLHRAAVVEAAQLDFNVSREMFREHVLRQLREKVVVGIFDELAQITRQLHRSQVKIMQSLQILHVVLAVIGQLSGHELVDPELVNIEDEFADDLIGARENLFNDVVMLTAKRDDRLKYILASNVACLKGNKDESCDESTKLALITAWLCSM